MVLLMLILKYCLPPCRFTHDPESVGVAQRQPRLDSQLNHHSDRAENNTAVTDHVTTSSPLTLSLSTNDSATAITIGTYPSQDSTFDRGEYETDLVLSVALVGDKHVPWFTCDGDVQAEPVQVDSTHQNNERYSICILWVCDPA
jgi:hypothetical protein